MSAPEADSVQLLPRSSIPKPRASTDVEMESRSASQAAPASRAAPAPAATADAATADRTPTAVVESGAAAAASTRRRSTMPGAAFSATKATNGSCHPTSARTLRGGQASCLRPGLIDALTTRRKSASDGALDAQFHESNIHSWSLLQAGCMLISRHKGYLHPISHEIHRDWAHPSHIRNGTGRSCRPRRRPSGKRGLRCGCCSRWQSSARRSACLKASCTRA